MVYPGRSKRFGFDMEHLKYRYSLVAR